MIPIAVPGTFLALPACFKEWRQVNMFSCMKPGTTDHILRSASGPGAFDRLSSLRVSGMHKNCGRQCYGTRRKHNHSVHKVKGLRGHSVAGTEPLASSRSLNLEKHHGAAPERSVLSSQVERT